MIETNPIEWPGLDNIRDNADFYKKVFLQEKVIAFRNANLTYEQQEELTYALGEMFNAYPTKFIGNLERYIEDHANLKKNATSDTGDDVRLIWHQEHVYWDNSIIFATWNNIIFNTNKENGKTYFYDMCQVYKDLPEDSQEFLKKCTSNSYDNNRTKQILEYNPIGYHWLTKEPVVRLMFHEIKEGKNDLKLYDGISATPEQNEKFLRIAKEINDLVKNDETKRIVHKWQKGDVIIPDLYKGAHAVTGGFNSEDRKFTGIWSFEHPNNLPNNLQE
jgi:alpha-ketoglutarate-dependent taurine dioxygenase